MKDSAALKALEGLLGIAFGRTGPEAGEVAARILDAAGRCGWDAVADLAAEQGVAGLVSDGLQYLYDNCPGAENSLPADKLRYDLFATTLSRESEWARSVDSASRLAAIFAAGGLRTVVLKGAAFAALYPEPSHRDFGDLDIFLLNAEGECACEAGNALMEKAGIAVDRSYYKNSSFRFEGLEVENHRFCTPVRGSASRKHFERLLQGLLKDGGLIPLGGPDHAHADSEASIPNEGADGTGAKGFACACNSCGTGASGGGDSGTRQAESAAPGQYVLYSPPPLFNALLCLAHARFHFLFEGGITLRHVCDFAACIRGLANCANCTDTSNVGCSSNDGGSSESLRFESICREYALLNFACALGRASERVCGVKPPFDCPPDEKADCILLEGMLETGRSAPDYGNSLKSRLSRMLSYRSRRERFLAFSDTSATAEILRTVFGYFFDRNPKL